MAERVKLHLRVETRLSPDRVALSLIDFSERRLGYWPNLDPAKYEVHETGRSSAVVTEGSVEPDIWARERYEWAGSVITIRALESNFCVPGDGTRIDISPREWGGSKIELAWEREAATPEWQPLMDAMRQDGEQYLLAGYRDAWEALADREARERHS